MEPSHDVKIGIEKLNVITDKIGDNTYLHLYHGTKKSNHTKIIKSGKFKSGTFFTPDEKIALRYARMTGGTPIHMLASINADGLTFNGYYFIAKQDLIFKNGKYEPKNPIMESRVLDNKKVYQNLDEETFIHFTTLPRAKEIKESRHLLINPPYEKFGSDTVDAISATLGKYVPKTQHTHIGDINKLVAILFKTDKVPDYGYPEEVKWHEDVPLKDIRIVRVKDAIEILNNNNSPDSEDYEITYKKEPVMESFIKSLERPGNESLIEAILEGYIIIFENNESSMPPFDVDVDSLTNEQLRKINNKIRISGYDMHGPDDVKESLKKQQKLGKFYSEDWKNAVDLSIERKKSALTKLSSSPNLKRKIAKEFGFTNYWETTGYIMQDGSQIDFSGRNKGNKYNTREIDHAEISYLLDNSDSKFDFIKMGNIRIVPEGGGINLYVQPTKQQKSKLHDFINFRNGEVTLDIGNGGLNMQYPEGTSPYRVLRDIDAFFAGKEVLPLSTVEMYH